MSSPDEVGRDERIEMLRRMLRIRRFEMAATTLHGEGHVPGAIHTSVGQEAEIVGACMAVRPDDYMLGNHRSHGHPLGKGSMPNRLMAELLGRVDGVNRGKGGSMHLADFAVGSLGESSIVGSGIPVAAGAALASLLRGDDRVCLCFFGDGASNEGAFHEGLNLAAVWKLPVVYVCENNGYGATTSAKDVVAVEDIAVRAVSYGFPGETVDGQDVLAVHEAVARAVARARAGEGPSLVEAKTYRFDNHSVGLHVENYRTAQEIENWRQRDPVGAFEKRLVEDGTATRREIDELEAEVGEEIDAAVAFALASPVPAPEEAYDFVFVESGTPRGSVVSGGFRG